VVTAAAHPPFEDSIPRARLGFAAIAVVLAHRIGLLTRYLCAAATDAVTAAERGTDVLLFNGSALFCEDIADGLRIPAIGCSRSPSNRPARSRRSWATRPGRLAGWATVLADWSRRGRLLVAARVAVPAHGRGRPPTAARHHGGAGRPSILTPVYADQPLWAARVHALGAGPKPLPLRKLTADALAAAIRDAIDNKHYGVAADDLSSRVSTEDSVTPVLKALESVHPA
jgi:hypothetical protein